MNDIRNVSVHENFARLQAGNDIGGYPAIGTADPQELESLESRQPVKVVRVCRDAFRRPFDVRLTRPFAIFRT